MADLIATNRLTAIVGTGVSGMAVARFLHAAGRRIVMFDTRDNPPNAAALRRELPDVHCEFGQWDEALLQDADEIVVSPGVSKHLPALQRAEAEGIDLIGDVELFVRYAQAPIVAITGSNAKSTVTTLVGEMARAAGKKVAVGGNLGVPVLELLDDQVELYVLELSSFQLETTRQLGAAVACILNISADHMDRYPNLPAYHAAKQRIYYGAKHIVANRRDPLTQPLLARDTALSFFGGPADFRNMGIVQHEGEDWLADELQPLLPVGDLRIAGRHNVDNALAALAIGKAAGLPRAAMLEALRRFEGLEHRCQWVARCAQVDYFNDSKGTNVGATLAAIEGLQRPPAKLVVILGGEGKGADFSPLRSAMRKAARAAVLIGRDADLIALALDAVVPVEQAADMRDAVMRAARLAQPGDAVLLSPACASFDMFSGYVERGQAFCRAVEEVTCA